LRQIEDAVPAVGEDAKHLRIAIGDSTIQSRRLGDYAAGSVEPLVQQQITSLSASIQCLLYPDAATENPRSNI
jgi:hypothetical protein